MSFTPRSYLAHFLCVQVRPLGPAGRLQLAKDLAELQLAVGASLFPLEQLGQPYRWGHARGYIYCIANDGASSVFFEGYAVDEYARFGRSQRILIKMCTHERSLRCLRDCAAGVRVF